MRGSVEMMNAMRGEFGVEPDTYWSLLTTFDRECTAKGKRHTGINDYRAHFFDWTRRHMEINGKDGNKNKGKGYGDNQQRQGHDYGLKERDREMRKNMDNMLAKYGLTSDDVGF